MSINFTMYHITYSQSFPLTCLTSGSPPPWCLRKLGGKLRPKKLMVCLIYLQLGRLVAANAGPSRAHSGNLKAWLGETRRERHVQRTRGRSTTGRHAGVTLKMRPQPLVHVHRAPLMVLSVCWTVEWKASDEFILGRDLVAHYGLPILSLLG